MVSYCQKDIVVNISKLLQKNSTEIKEYFNDLLLGKNIVCEINKKISYDCLKFINSNDILSLLLVKVNEYLGLN